MRTLGDKINDVIIDNTMPDRGRHGEVLIGPERRRKWPLTEKLAIVAESFEDGAIVSHVAQRHGLSPQQLFGWRRQVRAHVPKSPAPERLSPEVPAFTPVVIGELSPRQGPPALPEVTGSMPATSIEITVGGATIRVSGPVDAKLLTAVLRAVKATS